MAKSKSSQIDPATLAFETGRNALYAHPIFSPLLHRVSIIRRNDHQNNGVPQRGWAIVHSNGAIYVHPTRRAEAGEWVYVLAHCLLHLAWNHIRPNPSPAWCAACDCMVARFLDDIALGTRPEELWPANAPLPAFPGRDEAALERAFQDGIPPFALSLGTVTGHPDTLWVEAPLNSWRTAPDWAQLFSSGLSEAVASAVRVASGDNNPNRPRTPAERARSWFIASFPLLGALAAGFELIEDMKVCGQLDIPVAAIHIERRELFFNPLVGLNEGEMRFVMAHELLHAGLRHDVRQGTRDPYYWNCACDFVINDWILEMGIGEPPSIGMLHDPSLRGMSAEAVYDLMMKNLRQFRRLLTMRGNSQSDILSSDTDFEARMAATSLDAWLRGALVQGLQLHGSQGRGFLPAGLVEEIRALEMPVVPWDVGLAHWFDSHFAPLEKRRSYARLSRRQSSTPDIARPALIVPEEMKQSRTFGVVLDTSGSMEKKLLAKALGTIASYAIAHEVAAVRVVFCDASAYDAGFLRPEDIAGRVQVRGRGGTILQPAVHLLQDAPDFPDDAPILILTDGLCEPDLAVRREHAFVIPDGASLPFKARGPIFSVR